MDKIRGDGLSPGSDHSDADRIRRIADFWNAVRVCEETGAASREALEAKEQEVTDSLYRIPPDILRAETVTAQAILLIAGCGNP